MSRRLVWLVTPAAAFALACGRDNSPRVDDGLKNDLSLAAQAQPYSPQQFVSPTEQGYGQPNNPYAPRAPQRQTSTRQPVYGAPAPARRTSTSRAGTSSSSGGYVIPEQPQQVEKHTTRDAAIGAAAGAIIGATSSRDKVKGGLIGAAAGGILGAVIGNNADITRRP